MMNQTEVAELLARYVAGEIDSISLARLAQWAELAESNKNYIKRELELHVALQVCHDSTPFDAEKAYARFLTRKQLVAAEAAEPLVAARVAAQGATEPAGRKGRSVSLVRRIMQVAALVALLVAPFAAYWQGSKLRMERYAEMSIEAPMGAKSKIYLPDGTLVWLNAGSKLLYAQSFGIEDRQIKLEGEGYFEVAHNSKLPFKINSEALNLEVVGTQFNFKAYLEDERVVVSLMEGAVALENRMREMPQITLKPNEQLTLHKTTGKLYKTTLKGATARAWTNGELFFDEVPLREIAKELERGYNLRVVVADSLKDRKFYGVFVRENNQLEEVLKMIASTGRIKYKYENGKYLLY